MWRLWRKKLLALIPAFSPQEKGQKSVVRLGLIAIQIFQTEAWHNHRLCRSGRVPLPPPNPVHPVNPVKIQVPSPSVFTRANVDRESRGASNQSVPLMTTCLPEAVERARL